MALNSADCDNTKYALPNRAIEICQFRYNVICTFIPFESVPRISGLVLPNRLVHHCLVMHNFNFLLFVCICGARFSKTMLFGSFLAMQLLLLLSDALGWYSLNFLTSII
jgi:hypothetical protein